jgi:hypothetical protein
MLKIAVESRFSTKFLLKTLLKVLETFAFFLENSHRSFQQVRKNVLSKLIIGTKIGRKSFSIVNIL